MTLVQDFLEFNEVGIDLILVFQFYGCSNPLSYLVRLLNDHLGALAHEGI